MSPMQEAARIAVEKLQTHAPGGTYKGGAYAMAKKKTKPAPKVDPKKKSPPKKPKRKK